MKRIILLLAIGLLLAACGSTTTETAVSVPEEPARPETAVTEEDFAAETEPGESSAGLDTIAGFPATSVAEASLVRDRDWTKGTDDPLVTIIEYGDFQ